MALLEDIDNLISKVEEFNLQMASVPAVAPAKKSESANKSEAGGETDLDKKIHYITRNLGEIMNPEKAITEMKQIMSKRPLKIYWGTATTGAPHVAYFIPLSKLGDFLKAGCEVTVLLADVHAFLDAEKTPWELLDHRVAYYKAVISSMLKAVGVPIERLKFVRGSTFQLKKEYTLDMYKLCAKTSVGQAKRAGAEVVKQSDNPPLAPVIYPLLQTLDEEYLHVDVQFGGVDQRKIFAYASDNLNKILGYKSRIHLMNAICPSLTATKNSDSLDKMSSSSGSKIDPLEPTKSVWKKIKSAFCEPGNVDLNGPLSFCKFVVFPAFLDGKEFVVKRDGQADFVCTTFEELKQGFQAGEIHPKELKKATFDALEEVLVKVRKDFDSDEMRKLKTNAYPSKEDIAKAKASEETPAKTWILDYQKEKGQLPTIKEVRTGTGLSKREAKRALEDVKKMQK